ncbi:amidase family protein [Methylobacterium phyllosphaerae]
MHDGAARRPRLRREGPDRRRRYPHGGGSPDWPRVYPTPTRHAGVVQTLLDAGASVVGKTVTDEVSLGILGENAHDGTPLNPAAPDRVPGGSSSGSASAVAAGACDFALGTDTGGSVRVPASFCGLYGIRPTHGRIDFSGICVQAPSSDTCGWFARDAATFARVGAVLLGQALPDRLPHRSSWPPTRSASRTPPCRRRWPRRSTDWPPSSAIAAT